MKEYKKKGKKPKFCEYVIIKWHNRRGWIGVVYMTMTYHKAILKLYVSQNIKKIYKKNKQNGPKSNQNQILFRLRLVWFQQRKVIEGRNALV